MGPEHAARPRGDVARDQAIIESMAAVVNSGLTRNFKFETQLLISSYHWQVVANKFGCLARR